jgi:hypothetical protein
MLSVRFQLTCWYCVYIICIVARYADCVSLDAMYLIQSALYVRAKKKIKPGQSSLICSVWKYASANQRNIRNILIFTIFNYKIIRSIFLQVRRERGTSTTDPETDPVTDPQPVSHKSEH